MTYKELNQEREKQVTMYRKKEKEFESYRDGYERILQDIERRMHEAKQGLTKKIKKHFAGVDVEVSHSRYGLGVNVNGENMLTYSKDYLKSTLKDHIRDAIIEEYLEFYGEVEEASFSERFTTALSDLSSNIDFPLGK